MEQRNIRAAITAIEAYLPDYILTNEELSRMVDTSDEWIVSRVGIHERRILKDKDKGMTYMAIKAVKTLMDKNGIEPGEIDGVICSTVTPDMVFPASAAIITILSAPSTTNSGTSRRSPPSTVTNGESCTKPDFASAV